MWHTITDCIAQTSRDIFGEPLLLQSKVGPPQEFSGIYEEVTSFDGLNGGSSLMGENATIDVRSEDLTFTPHREDMFIIKRTGKRYKLIKVEYDGWAIHTFYLKEFV